MYKISLCNFNTEEKENYVYLKNKIKRLNAIEYRATLKKSFQMIIEKHGQWS